MLIKGGFIDRISIFLLLFSIHLSIFVLYLLTIFDINASYFLFLRVSEYLCHDTTCFGLSYLNKKYVHVFINRTDTLYLCYDWDTKWDHVKRYSSHCEHSLKIPYWNISLFPWHVECISFTLLTSKISRTNDSNMFICA